MYRLSMVVEAFPDPVHSFEFPDCPVTALSTFYGEIMHLFSRRVCHVCRCVEGIFGSRGRPFSSPKVIGKQICKCDTAGFGLFTPSRQGLVPKSFSIVHLLKILQHHHSRLDELSSSGLTTLACPEEVPVVNRPLNALSQAQEVEKSKLIGDMKSILSTISSNVWKCFNIPDSLKPYGVEVYGS